ncbi:MAG: hypothetical protein MUC60_11575 [Oscillatoria sp. Prado101]|nr:hypothetical protein [Oscillatoria sp. Prado101]
MLSALHYCPCAAGSRRPGERPVALHWQTAVAQHCADGTPIVKIRLSFSNRRAAGEIFVSNITISWHRIALISLGTFNLCKHNRGKSHYGKAVLPA